MRTSWYHRFFPIPKNMALNAVGVDISDHSVKIVDIRESGAGLFLSHFATKHIPDGTVVGGKIQNPNALSKVLAELRMQYSLDLVRFSLPEEQIYIFQIKIPKLPAKDIPDAIELILEEHVPIKAAEAVFDYDILEEEENNYYLEVAVAPLSLVESYASVFRDAGLHLISMEIEAVATSRALIKKDDTDSYLIADFGENHTGISIVADGHVFFASTIDIGGASITKMISKSLNISFDEAEKLKIKNGLKRNAENSELFSVILNSVSILKDEIHKHFIYWHTHPDELGRPRKPISKIILSGGDANLYGLPDYFSTSLRIPVKMGNPWVNVDASFKNIPAIPFAESLGYANAIGSALSNY